MELTPQQEKIKHKFRIDFTPSCQNCQHRLYITGHCEFHNSEVSDTDFCEDWKQQQTLSSPEEFKRVLNERRALGYDKKDVDTS